MRTNMQRSVVLFGLACVCAPSVSLAAIPVVWQTDLDHTSRNAIQRVKLTPDGQHLMVFHYTGDHTWGSTIPGRFEKLDAMTGSPAWDPPTKELTKSGEKLTANGWVDDSGNLYMMPTWGGYRFWEYDPELDTEICEYTPNSSAGFEYVKNIITDSAGNVYATGYVGSGSGRGSKVVKFAPTPCNSVVCEHLSRHTNAKDDYSSALALDSNGNIFRAGADAHDCSSSPQGRVIGHDANTCGEILNVSMAESDSEVFGLLIDNDDYIYIAYTYDRCSSGQERSVVQKWDQQGGVVWEHRFDDVGMSLRADAMLMGDTNSFYLAFQLNDGAVIYPGIAEFTTDGLLLWKDTIDRPGWSFSRSGFDSANGLIYVGLTQPSESVASPMNTQVLALAARDPVLDVTIDIKPGSDPNSINLGSHGVIPVAILTTEYFDATTVDPDTVELAGSTVAIRGNGNRLLAAYEDVDYDGDIDLVLHVETENLTLEAGTTEAVLTALTFDGQQVTGADTITIVNE